MCLTKPLVIFFFYNYSYFTIFLTEAIQDSPTINNITDAEFEKLYLNGQTRHANTRSVEPKSPTVIDVINLYLHKLTVFKYQM